MNTKFGIGDTVYFKNRFGDIVSGVVETIGITDFIGYSIKGMNSTNYFSYEDKLFETRKEVLENCIKMLKEQIKNLQEDIKLYEKDIENENTNN